MIRLDMPQGSQEWVEARLGIPTASNFNRILTPGGKLSKASETYACELIAERMLGAALDPFVSEWMERGKELEEQAFRYYELQREADVDRVGFLMTDDKRVGCSPDGLVGDDGGLEIKCPTAQVHVSYMLNVTNKYKCQVQGALWVSGRSWWDFVSFHPELPAVLVRFERDEKYIAALQSAVNEFCGNLEESVTWLRAAGYLDDEEAA